MASRISRPRTNCPPIICMALPIASRITGCAIRETTLSSERDVIISPTPAAFTIQSLLSPTPCSQSAAATLSRISSFAVFLSGMRSKASARHISEMPSSVCREYCCRNDSSSPVLRLLARKVLISASDRFSTAAESFFGQSRCFKSASTQAASSL